MKKNAIRSKKGSPAQAPDMVSEAIALYESKPSPGQLTLKLIGMKHDVDYRSASNDIDFIRLIRAGVSKNALNHLLKITGFSSLEIAKMLHLTDRTLRRFEGRDKFNPDQSERILELAGLYARGREVFDDMDEFKEWMNTSLLPLGDKKPKELLDTSLGIRMIMKELGRIEYGVFA